MIDTMCPICGYPDLSEPAYIGNGRASLEMCQCCGFQFGWHDYDQKISHAQWREKWIQDGMAWQSRGIKKPADWDPREHLKNVGVGA